MSFTYPVIDGRVQGSLPPETAMTVISGDVCTVYLQGEPLPPPPARTLGDLVAELHQRNHDQRIDREAAGVAYTFPDGSGTAQTRDARDLVNINGIVTNAIVAQAAGVTEAVLSFRDAENATHLMTPAQAIAFGVAIGAAIAGHYQRKWQIDAQIEALPSIEAAIAFDLAAAWAA